jgi:hypothetical protein
MRRDDDDDDDANDGRIRIRIGDLDRTFGC